MSPVDGTENPLHDDNPYEIRVQLKEGEPAALRGALVSLLLWRRVDSTVEALATHPREKR